MKESAWAASASPASTTTTRRWPRRAPTPSARSRITQASIARSILRPWPRLATVLSKGGPSDVLFHSSDREGGRRGTAHAQPAAEEERDESAAARGHGS